jgi:hypothetical protein
MACWAVALLRALRREKPRYVNRVMAEETNMVDRACFLIKLFHHNEEQIRQKQEHPTIFRIICLIKLD